MEAKNEGKTFGQLVLNGLKTIGTIYSLALVCYVLTHESAGVEGERVWFGVKAVVCFVPIAITLAIFYFFFRNHEAQYRRKAQISLIIAGVAISLFMSVAILPREEEVVLTTKCEPAKSMELVVAKFATTGNSHFDAAFYPEISDDVREIDSIIEVRYLNQKLSVGSHDERKLKAMADSFCMKEGLLVFGNIEDDEFHVPTISSNFYFAQGNEHLELFSFRNLVLQLEPVRVFWDVDFSVNELVCLTEFALGLIYREKGNTAYSYRYFSHFKKKCTGNDYLSMLVEYELMRYDFGELNINRKSAMREIFKHCGEIERLSKRIGKLNDTQQQILRNSNELKQFVINAQINLSPTIRAQAHTAKGSLGEKNQVAIEFIETDNVKPVEYAVDNPEQVTATEMLSPVLPPVEAEPACIVSDKPSVEFFRKLARQEFADGVSFIIGDDLYRKGEQLLDIHHNELRLQKMIYKKSTLLGRKLLFTHDFQFEMVLEIRFFGCANGKEKLLFVSNKEVRGDEIIDKYFFVDGFDNLKRIGRVEILYFPDGRPRFGNHTSKDKDEKGNIKFSRKLRSS